MAFIASFVQNIFCLLNIKHQREKSRSHENVLKFFICWLMDIIKLVNKNHTHTFSMEYTLNILNTFSLHLTIS